MTMEQGFDPRSITVLVVDDEPRLVDVLRLDLEIEGYRVVAAANGYEALDRLKARTSNIRIVRDRSPVG